MWPLVRLEILPDRGSLTGSRRLAIDVTYECDQLGRFE
jgi:hypothetical protein